MMNEVILEVKNLSKTFRLRSTSADSVKVLLQNFLSPRNFISGNFQALKNISFNVRQGQAIGIIGKNGAGKSTLLRVLTGITPPDEGEINFYGKAVSILDIGAGFHPELSGRENIFLSASLYDFSKKQVEEKLDAIIAFSGIQKFIDEPVKNYSSGMYLRLAFSIISFIDADIYLFDEVINVGDANFQAKCKQRMEELIAAGKTILIASHNFNDVVNMCNHIILMEDGKIVDEGGADVIQKYMVQALPQYFSFSDKDFYHFKKIKNEEQLPVKILNAELKDFVLCEDGLDCECAFKIFFEVENYSPVQFVIRLKFYDSTGVLVFVCSSLKLSDSTNETGKYLIEFELPANIFNTRMYSVDMSVIDLKQKELLVNEDKFLTFKVSAKNTNANELKDNFPGVVKLPVITRAKKLN